MSRIRPSIIILGYPGLVPPGTLKYRCLACEKHFPIAASTRQTITDLRAAKTAYLVVCHPCWTVMARNIPAASSYEVQGAREHRALRGLDP